MHSGGCAALIVRLSTLRCVSQAEQLLIAAELLGRLNSAGSARSRKLELRLRTVTSRGSGDKATVNRLVSASCLTLEVRQDVDEDFLSHSVGWKAGERL